MLAAASAVGNCLGCSVLDNRSWPGIWAGAALVNASVQSSVVAAVTIGTGNTLEALTGALLIRRFSGVPYRFERGEDAVKFFAVVAPSAAVAATIGVSGLAFAGAAPVGVRTRATRALRKERDSLESKVQESTRELQSEIGRAHV